MGATTFITFAQGETPEVAFTYEKARAQHDNGHSGYSGTIAEKDSFVVLEVPASFKGTTEDYIEQLLDDASSPVAHKAGPAGCILISSSDKTSREFSKVKREHFPHKGTRKWESIYVVYSEDEDFLRGYEEVSYSKFKDEAVKMAVDYSKEHRTEVFVQLEKRPVDASSTVFKATPVYKDVLVKNGIHQYAFFGWASN